MTDGTAAERMEIRRSARRRKSIAVHREGDTIVVNAPMWMSEVEVERHARDLVVRLRRRERQPASDTELLTRALWLRLEFLPDAPEPASVQWTQMATRWGSCTTLDRSIRLAEALRRAPQYVIDAVIVHELAHLLEADHGAEFHRLIARYPENTRADAFLAGMSFAKGVTLAY